jgi:hypothetical protein
MPLDRRRFLGITAALPLAISARALGSTLVPLDEWPLDEWPRAECLLLDFGEHCALRESLAGFERGLAAASIRFHRAALEAIRPADFVSAPGAVLHSSASAQALRQLIDRGSIVIYESGAAYAEPEAFATEQQLLRDYFGLSVQAPVELWAAWPGHGRPAYVHYAWPARVMVRDFSRIIAVSEGGSAVARLGDIPVASRVRLGQGAFIFLGSPLGPHLAFGDPEAQTLLQALIALAISFQAPAFSKSPVLSAAKEWVRAEGSSSVSCLPTPVSRLPSSDF